MLLTIDLVANRDPFVLIRDGMQSGQAQSFARTLDNHQDPDERRQLAVVLLAGAFDAHAREINTLTGSTKPCDLELKKALSGTLNAITAPLQDLPYRLWDALLIELGNGRADHALLIVQIHNNAVKNIINHGGPTRADDFLYDAALLAAGAD